jgi:hypothetical protein
MFQNELPNWHEECSCEGVRFGDDFMSQGNPRGWREICEEVLRTKDEDKVNALLDELLRALDERDQKRDSPNPDDHL